MNIQTAITGDLPSRDDAETALSILKSWAVRAKDEEIAALDPAVQALLGDVPYPHLSRDFPDDFEVDPAYKDDLPDLQNGPSSLIRGAKRQIQHVGISNFRLPIRFHRKDGDDLTLETSVTGSVSLEADKKGINMSRIMRTFYRRAEETFSFDVIEAALDDYKTDLESFDARIQMRFSFPVKVDSLGCRGISTTISRWNWSNKTAFVKNSCISTMFTRRRAHAHWNSANMHAARADNLPRRIRSAQSHGCL
jgi:GTP cyclohydrolase I